jgi:hypothetical protein
MACQAIRVIQLQWLQQFLIPQKIKKDYSIIKFFSLGKQQPTLFFLLSGFLPGILMLCLYTP